MKLRPQLTCSDYEIAAHLRNIDRLVLCNGLNDGYRVIIVPPRLHCVIPGLY